MGKPCKEDNCENPRWSSGYCQQHDKVYNPEKYLIKKKGVVSTATPITPKKRSFIKPISDKQASKLAEYRVVRDAYLKANPVCQFKGCTSRDVCVHHAKGRVGDLLSDNRYFRSLCDHHHKLIELKPTLAKELGLSLNRLSNIL